MRGCSIPTVAHTKVPQDHGVNVGAEVSAGQRRSGMSRATFHGVAGRQWPVRRAAERTRTQHGGASWIEGSDTGTRHPIGNMEPPR